MLTFFEKNHFDFDNGDVYQPRKLNLCHDGKRTEYKLTEIGNWNDRIDSWYCGKNVWYDMCRHPDTSNCTYKDLVSSGAGHIKNPDIDWGDQMSSVILGPYDPQKIGAVTLFHHNECHGNSARFYWNPDDPNGGVYNHRDMQKAGMP